MTDPITELPEAAASAAWSWAELKARLEELRAGVAAEIGRYPPPITACDAQFNHLTERRRLISAELVRLERAALEGGATDGGVDAFVQASPLRADLRAGRSGGSSGAP